MWAGGEHAFCSAGPVMVEAPYSCWLPAKKMWGHSSMMKGSSSLSGKHASVSVHAALLAAQTVKHLQELAEPVVRSSPIATCASRKTAGRRGEGREGRKTRSGGSEVTPLEQALQDVERAIEGRILDDILHILTCGGGKGGQAVKAAEQAPTTRDALAISPSCPVAAPTRV